MKKIIICILLITAMLAVACEPSTSNSVGEAVASAPPSPPPPPPAEEGVVPSNQVVDSE